MALGLSLQAADRVTGKFQNEGYHTENKSNSFFREHEDFSLLCTQSLILTAPQRMKSHFKDCSLLQPAVTIREPEVYFIYKPELKTASPLVSTEPTFLITFDTIIIIIS